jgi:putative membrane protein
MRITGRTAKAGVASGTGAAERRPRAGAPGRRRARRPDGAAASSSSSDKSRGVRHWPRGFPRCGLALHLSEPAAQDAHTLFTAPSHIPEILRLQQRRSAVTYGSGHDEEERKMGFNDMMSGWGGGWITWTMYLGMIAFWVGVVALIVWGIKALVVSGGAQTVPRVSRENAADVLKRRYAAGEIDSAEFEQKRRELF